LRPDDTKNKNSEPGTEATMNEIIELERTIAEKEYEQYLLASRRRELEDRLASLLGAHKRQHAAA
jgi:hypothetical protein